MRLNHPVSACSTDKKSQEQDPKNRDCCSLFQDIDRYGEKRPKGRLGLYRRLVWRYIGLSIRRQSNISRIVSHEEQYDHDGGDYGDAGDENRRSPAITLGDFRQGRQEDELSRGTTRGQEAGDQPPALDEPAGGDGCAQN